MEARKILDGRVTRVGYKSSNELFLELDSEC